VRRRDLLRYGAASVLALPFLRAERSLRAHVQGTNARRLIVLYHPDGVPGASSNGEPSSWHAYGDATTFTLPPLLAALAPYRNQCAFFRGLSMGATDAGSHPGGAKKLLTGVDGGNGISIDQRLAQSVGSGDPFHSLYLGAMANQNGASGDKHISYVAPGVSASPDDDPVGAFMRVFGTAGTTNGGGGTDAARKLSILDPGLSKGRSITDG
jgi:hypothetical protein